MGGMRGTPSWSFSSVTLGGERRGVISVACIKGGCSAVSGRCGEGRWVVFLMLGGGEGEAAVGASSSGWGGVPSLLDGDGRVSV